MAALSLLIVAVGFVRFGIDLWTYSHASTASTELNYRGLGGALGGGIMFGLFILIYRWRKH
jgi:uncharacterized membrane protein YidH (DUF202 family)